MLKCKEKQNKRRARGLLLFLEDIIKNNKSKALKDWFDCVIGVMYGSLELVDDNQNLSIDYCADTNVLWWRFYEWLFVGSFLRSFGNLKHF